MTFHKNAARLLAILSLAAAGGAWAQMTPVGTWHNVDDKTGEIKSEIRIFEAEGGALKDPAGFVKRINDLMLALSIAGK